MPPLTALVVVVLAIPKKIQNNIFLRTHLKRIIEKLHVVTPGIKAAG